MGVFQAGLSIRLLKKCSIALIVGYGICKKNILKKNGQSNPAGAKLPWLLDPTMGSGFKNAESFTSHDATQSHISLA